MNPRHVGKVALAASPLLLAVPGIRQLADSTMALLMLVEFPALLLSGWAVATTLPSQLHRMLCRMDASGITSQTALLVTFSYWMIPAALDDALMSDSAYAARHLTWLGCGVLLGIRGRRSSPTVLLFFLGNIAWMSATAGLLYADSTSRLCVNYLVQDQVVAGHGLIAVAVLATCVSLWAWRQTQRPNARTQAPAPVAHQAPHT